MTTSTEPLWCVVPAAGSGARFGADVPKQYALLGGKPMLLHTLERLARHERIAGVVVAIAKDDAHWPALSARAGERVIATVGGATRADSVLAGLRAIADRVPADRFVLVHDAARPCVSGSDIERLIDTAGGAGGGLLAAPLRDTLKRAGAGNRSEGTEPRDARWRALTPQMFRHGELVEAIESALRAGIAVTDEAMAMERAGHRPLLVEGAESNIKVTTREDLALAEFLLNRGV
jgi:2-C-methyl-D-erythritol 4-phosphate cytidylyltransferase